MVKCLQQQCCLCNRRCVGIDLVNYSWTINNVECVSKIREVHSAMYTTFLFQKFFFDSFFSLALWVSMTLHEPGVFFHTFFM